MIDDWAARPVLTGTLVRLEPLTIEHAEPLFAAGADPGVWTWLPGTRPRSAGEMRRQVAATLAACAAGQRLPWAQVDLRTGTVAGTTSYYDIDPVHRAVAIGYTWLGTPWQRSGINTEAKLLLLRRAFDELGAIRVVWHTDRRNVRSQRAIERLGGVREGLLRQHRILADGSYRDTVTYSMLDSEWPAAERFLTDALRHPHVGRPAAE